MADQQIVKLNQRGVLTLPSSIRKSYNLKPGDTLSVVDPGGALILTPHRFEVDKLADRLRASWKVLGSPWPGCWMCSMGRGNVKRAELFLDTSALFAAVWLNRGGGRELLRLERHLGSSVAMSSLKSRPY